MSFPYNVPVGICLPFPEAPVRLPPPGSCADAIKQYKDKVARIADFFIFVICFLTYNRIITCFLQFKVLMKGGKTIMNGNS
jgi:hypothetical protein